MSDALTIDNVVKQFPGDVQAVDGVSLSVPQGAFLVLLGPSGCGKTTMLRMLAGLEAPTSGRIDFGETTVADGQLGIQLSPAKRNVGLVFQTYALWPHMTVERNVAWPLKVAKWPKDRQRERVREVLDLLDIGELAGRYPGEVSGGQQQRVAIARTIALRPKVLLFDEPLSNLDAKLRTEMRTELLRVHRATGATSVYVTHDQVEAVTMATHVAVMRAGKVEQFAPPREVLEHPATPFVATFVGTPPANLVPTRRDGGVLRFAGAVLETDDSSADRGTLLMYRPDSLDVADAPGERTVTGEFVEATPLAGRVVVTIIVEGQRLRAVAGTIPTAEIGSELHVSFPPQPDGRFDAPAPDDEVVAA